MDTRDAIERYLASPGLSDATRGPIASISSRLPTGSDGETSTSSVSTQPCSPTTPPSSGAAAHAGSRRRRSRASSRPCAPFSGTRSGAGRVPDIRLSPRRPRRLPQVDKPAEIDRELAALEGAEPLELRNRALAELVYSAGLRSRETVDLDLADVDFEQETVRVRGKGGKERIVPLGEEAAAWLARYLRDAPPEARTRRRRRLRLGAGSPPRHEHASAVRFPTPTASGTRSPRICSREAPTSVSSRSCSATARSRRRRSTATSTAAGSAVSTTGHIRVPEP